MKINVLLRRILKNTHPKLRSLLTGIATYIPGLHEFMSPSTGGTISARYCYSVWLRHLIMAYNNGLPTRPDSIAELGPGDSLGIGLAALISGASKYYAFDVVNFSHSKRNMEIFEELVKLYKAREVIPDNNEFPEIKPRLDSYEFPNHILSDEHLNEALKEDRLDSIRKALLSLGNEVENNIQVAYFVPWYDSKVIKENSIDMIFSQAVMEHVEDLVHTYGVLQKWLKPGGFMSHQIDFRSHGTAKNWNGHWGYSDFTWKIIKGRRPYLLNRQYHSVHISLLLKFGFEVVCDAKTKDNLGIKRKSLASKFKNMSDDDFTTSTAFIQATKKSN